MSCFVDPLRGQCDGAERVVGALAPLALILLYLTGALIAYSIRRAAKGPFRDEEQLRRGSSALIGAPLRHFFAWATKPIGALLRWSALPANALTTLSVLLASAAAITLAAGRFSLGGWLYLGSGLCDFFDGRIARESGSSSSRGAALDSVLDRYSDAIVLVGLAWYYRGSWVLLAIGALMIGTFLVPYIRAKGESLGVETTLGLMQRPERMVYLGLALALSPLLSVIYAPENRHPQHVLAIIAIVAIAASTLVTAGQRFAHLLRSLSNPEQQGARWISTAQGSLLRFSVASLLATGADFALVWVLVAFGGLVPWLATLVGCALGAVGNFTINRLWTFATTGAARRQARRYAFVSSSSAALNSGGVAVLLLLPMDYRIAWGLARASVWIFWNYPLNRDYVFHVDPTALRGEAPAPTPLPGEPSELTARSM